MKTPNITPIASAEVVRLYAEGLSIRQIGRRLGRSHEGVRVILRRVGVELRPPHIHSPAREARA